MPLFIIFTCLFAYAQSTPTLEITVSLRPEQTEVPVPIAVDVTRHLSGQSGNYQLEEVSTSGAKAVPCQISSEQNRAVLRFIIPPAPSSQPVTKRFRLTRTERAASPAFRLEDLEGKHLRLSENERPVFVFNYGMMLKAGVAEKYRRACYVHPLFDLEGVALTDDFPQDHLHHRGMSWTWPIVKVGDSPKVYDIWSCEGAGQKFHHVLGHELGPVCARLGLSNGWYVGEKKIVDETVWLTVFRAGEVGRVMDVDITLTATEQPVTIGGRPGKGYGGFTIRFAPRQETSLHTSAGQLPKDIDDTPFTWSDLSAKFSGSNNVSGIAIFDHAQNPAHPTTWTNRYYGILNPTYPSVKTHELKHGQPLRLRYRVWIHRGDARSGKVAAAFAAFSQPIEVQVSGRE